MLPVEFEATLTYLNNANRNIFVQDEGLAIFVRPGADVNLALGDRVRVRGRTYPSFRPYVVASSIEFVRHGELPKPVSATFDRLIRAKLDGAVVKIRGVVQTTDLTLVTGKPDTTLKILTDGGIIEAVVDNYDPGKLKGLLDSEIEVIGIDAGKFDGKKQQTGVVIHAASFSNIKVLKRATSSPWVLPVTPMDEILSAFHDKNLTHRIRVQGTITYNQPGSAVILQDLDRSLWIRTDSITPLHIGKRADATGFPSVHDGFLTLTESEILEGADFAPVHPQLENWHLLASSKHIFDLVSIEGEVLTSVHGTFQDEYVLLADGHVFSAIYRHPEAASAPLSPFVDLAEGSRIRVSGICVTEGGNPFGRDVPFNILLRSSGDITLIARPSMLNTANLILVVGALLLVALAVTGWGWVLQRKVHLQTAARRAIEARYHIAFETSLDFICINRFSDEVYVDANKAFLDMVGYERKEVVGRTPQQLKIWSDLRDRQKLFEILRDNGSCRSLEAQFGKKNGEVFWGQMSATVMDIDGVPCLLSITRDISDAKAAENEIRSLAFYDTLTHLPNRRLVTERLKKTLASSARSNRKGAVLFIDLDNFKTLNDTLGHKTGDSLLQEVAVRLTACIRDADTVARLGGDEFVVILEDLSEMTEEAAAHAERVAEKILSTVNGVYLLAGREWLSSCSIGVTVFGELKDTADDVLHQADIAMYQAKAAGRSAVRFFAPALQTAINARALLEGDLRQAIGTDQFQLYYQPQVKSGILIGAEALLRWKHPLRGLRLPGEFIPLAEETGLILSLGSWVLETACEQIAEWSRHEATEALCIGVNISARQLRQPDFVEEVLSVLHRTGAPKNKLKLELTESMLVDNVEGVITKMTLLKSHGIRFSLDDFGTGYSSLAYLKRFPLDELKIDRAFVRDMLVDVTSGAIAQTIISLSYAMSLSVIAEGVETEEQREFLAKLGCHSYQGYLFGPPVPINEFQRLVLEPEGAGPSHAAGPS